MRRIGSKIAGDRESDGDGDEDGDHSRDGPGGGRKSRVKEGDKVQRKSSLKVKTQPRRPNDSIPVPDERESGWRKLKCILSSLPGLLEKVQDFYLRIAAATEEQKRQDHHDRHTATGGSILSDRSGSRSRVVKKRDSVTSNRSRLSTDRGSDGSGPFKTTDKFIDYISETLYLATNCVSELMNGLPGLRGEEANPKTGGPSCPVSLLPDYVIRFTEEGQVTPDVQLNAGELYRRKLLSGMQYKVVLNVNGKAVTHSEPVLIRHPSLIADFNQFFELRLIHEPSTLSVDIYAVTTGVIACLTKGSLHL